MPGKEGESRGGLCCIAGAPTTAYSPLRMLMNPSLQGLFTGKLRRHNFPKEQFRAGQAFVQNGALMVSFLYLPLLGCLGERACVLSGSPAQCLGPSGHMLT